MRKTTFLLAFLMLTLGLAAQVNLVKNSGFETWTDGSLNDWKINVAGSTITENSSIVNEGAKSLKVDATNATGTVSISQAVAGIVPGKTYEVKISYYIENGDGTDARIWANFTKEGGYFTSAELDATGFTAVLRGPDNKYFADERGVWKTYTVEFVAPANSTGFDFQFRVYKSGVVYWDNMSLVEKGSTTPVLNANPASLSFDAKVGETATAQTVTVQGANLTAAPTYSISGADAAMFAATGDLTITGGELNVKFTPTTTGSKTASLIIKSGDIFKTLQLIGVATDDSNLYGLDDSTPLTSLNEPFGDGTATAADLPAKWISVSVQGDRKWEVKRYNDNNYAQMSAHKGTGKYQTLLISPAINFDAIDKTAVKFDWNSGFANGAVLKVYVMAKDMTKTEVKSINDDVNTSGYGAGFTTETLDLTAHSGVKFLVFEYNGEAGAATTTYQVDNVIADVKSGLKITKFDELKLWTSNNKINFGATAGETVEVYNTVGQRMFNALTTEGQNEISLNHRGIVIVKVGNRVGKVIL